MSIILNNQSIAGKYIYKEYIPQSYRYIGEIFQSILPIEDIRVALLDGHIIASSDGYSDFIQHLTSLSLIYPQLICTEDEWQTSNTTYGECGKFVINNDGSIRLPKIVSFVQGLKSLADLANIVEAGLPNITGDIGEAVLPGGQEVYKYGAFTKSFTNTSASWGSTTAYRYDVSFDASDSNHIYGNSNTVQPQAIQYPYYIVLATGVTQEITAKEELVVNNSNILGDSKYSSLDIENTSWLKSEGQKNYRDNYPDYYDWIVKEYNGTSNNLKKDINVYKIGDLTVKDGVLSGFSENSYAITPKINYSNANSWEICTQKFSISSLQSLETILFNNTSTDGADGIAIFIRANGNTSWCVQSVLGTYIFKRDANTNIQINTEYQFKLEFTGSAYNFYLSTNGGSFVLVDTYTSSTKANLNISLAIGKGLGQYWKGNPIDLKESYININGQRLWTGYRKNIVLENEQHTEYDYILNENEQSFILPLLDGSEDLPSDRYEDLELLDAGSKYIAPANGWYYLAKNITALGQYVNLTNDTKHIGMLTSNSSQVSNVSCFTLAQKGDSVTPWYTAGGSVLQFRFIYAQGNGSLYYYVGDVVKNPSLVNVGAITNTLTKKVDIDAKNFSTNGKSLISSYGMPSNKYINLTVGASGTTYTAPANGWYVLGFAYAGAHYVTLVNNTSGIMFVVPISNGSVNVSIPAKKGDIVYIEYDHYSSSYFRFIYAEGEV